MSELTVVDATSPIELGVADDVIAGLKGRLMGLKADTPQGYVMVKSAISEVIKHRTGVERARKSLKASALEWGRKVDAEARRVNDLILEIETPLREEKARVDDEAERQRDEQEAAERLLIDAKERELAEARQEEENAQREAEAKQREAEAAKLIEQQNALAKERTKLEDERREQQETLEAERLKIVADREEFEKVKRAVEEGVRKEREAVMAAECEAQEKEERAKEVELEKDRLAQEKIENERLAEERKPDREKLEEMVRRLADFELPTVTTMWGRGISILAHDLIIDAAREIQNDISLTGPQDDKSSPSDL